MCAIIGVLGNKLPDKETFIKARDTMTHRGPDDAGLYYSPKEGVALGHRRLSIIDLSEAGRQPFFSKDGAVGIVFNGEIYNFRELRETLKGFYPFETKTDTEVIIAAYMKWGIECVKHLRGMFAFVIWDKKRETLFVVRDRLGIKPLYWSMHDGNFHFSSEIKGILASSEMPRVLDKRALLDYLSYRYPLGERTFFQGIFSLLPGHYMVLKRASVLQIKKYWELPIVENKEDPGEEAVLKNTEKLLKETVQSHMISDVPLGAYLSGGLDSSLLVAFMSSLSKSPVKTFSVGFEEDGFSELEYASIVARSLGTEHHEIVLRQGEYMNLLPETIKIKDVPLHVPNEVALHALSKELKKHITVVLSGEGADELFGGYGRILRSGDDLLHMRELVHNDNGKQKRVLIKNLQEKYGDVRYEKSVDHFLAQYPYVKPSKTEELLSGDFGEGLRRDLLNTSFVEKHFDRASRVSPSEQYTHFLQEIHLLGILHRLDTSSMAASVEARVPYIDHRVVEEISALPLKYKLAWRSKEDEEKARVLNSDQISDVHDTTKYLLRKIGSRHLPASIYERKKFSFVVPLDRWFGGDLKKNARELLLSDDARSKALFKPTVLEQWISRDDKRGEFSSSSHGRDIWAILNIELWMREYGVIF